MCPGLFNALNGLGGGGRVDTTTNANSNATHYATFAFFAFFAGPVNNLLGPRLTLLLGSTGYVLTIASYLAVNNHPAAAPFVIVAGAIQGVCAGLLWTAQGSLMLAYSTESQKGLFIGIFWSIFNLGSVVGASVSLGQNFNSKTNSVGNGTYIGFLILTLIGVFIPILMADPDKIIRTDGTKVECPRLPSLRTAFNWFYTWQFNDYNSALFNIRARSLNNLVYWIAQILGSVGLAFLLDLKCFSWRLRAYMGWLILLIMVLVVHIWAYFYQVQYTRETVKATTVKIDIHDKPYVGHVWLYIFCGLLDAMWQTNVYWLMGVMSRDPATLAHFVGFYKGIQSAGAAGVWRADGIELPYMNIFIATWVLLAVGLVSALPMIVMRVKNDTRNAPESPTCASRTTSDEKSVEECE
ncbi:unnamed protein product [Somion occarium]|uniref:UNC93-like protein n=1 Tax=Somion occarium TaxID=3059160 RepID=A0ABP1CQA0_9APHY